MDPPPTPNPIPGAIVVGKTYDLASDRAEGGEVSEVVSLRVGQRSIDTALDLLLLLVEAAHRRDKRDTLRTAASA
jgi:hypothetical protein